MKSKFLFLSIIMFTFSATGFSQAKQFSYYFDKDLNPSSSSNAVFNGKGIYQKDGLFEFRLYNSSNKNLVLIEHYTDSLLHLSEGSSESFYANNITESKGNYLSGKPDGLWLKWDSTGRIIDSTVYEKGEKIKETSLGYHKNGITDSLVNTDFRTDKYERKYYDDSARLGSIVNFTGQKGFVKYYVKGNLTSSDSVFSRLEIEAEYPGGNQAWMKYIVSRLQINADKLLSSGSYGSCIVKFIVSKEGKVVSAEATTMQGTVLAELAVRIIRSSSKWHPASQYGRPVNAYRLQPVTFNPPD
ncbi:MAG: energy transducer TonB [Ginsengibacter sp.]